jgi:hypothetical protein
MAEVLTLPPTKQEEKLHNEKTHSFINCFKMYNLYTLQS